MLASSPMSVSARLTDYRKEKNNTEASNFEDVSGKSSKVFGIRDLTALSSWKVKSGRGDATICSSDDCDHPSSWCPVSQVPGGLSLPS